MDTDGQGYRRFKCRSRAICGKTSGVTQFPDLCYEQLVQTTAVELLSTISTSIFQLPDQALLTILVNSLQRERSIIDISSMSESVGSDLDMQDSHMIEGEIEERQRLELQVIQLEKTVLNLLPQNAPPTFYDSSPYQQNASIDKARLIGYDISKNGICLSDRSPDTSGHESELDDSHILQRSAVLLKASPPVPGIQIYHMYRFGKRGQNIILNALPLPLPYMSQA
ncbi:hypothetical protein C7212DRAFT_348129 [Tuber magnatum]|uniref:Uncharacterized protein n=1 Tax=Tuber magnatum TaxID=42249 RepID=A0A317SGE7_9PEZI|nr:hypothetical protein C7212DRAFT_348129 [Tuber magnatum]